MAMSKCAALTVLSGDTNRHLLGQQRTVSKQLRQPPVHLALVENQLLAPGDDALHFRIDRKPVRHGNESVCNLHQLLARHASVYRLIEIFRLRRTIAAPLPPQKIHFERRRVLTGVVEAVLQFCASSSSITLSLIRALV